MTTGDASGLPRLTPIPHGTQLSWLHKPVLSWSRSIHPLLLLQGKAALIHDRRIITSSWLLLPVPLLLLLLPWEKSTLLLLLHCWTAQKGTAPKAATRASNSRVDDRVGRSGMAVARAAPHLPLPSPLLLLQWRLLQGFPPPPCRPGLIGPSTVAIASAEGCARWLSRAAREGRWVHRRKVPCCCPALQCSRPPPPLSSSPS